MTSNGTNTVARNVLVRIENLTKHYPLSSGLMSRKQEVLRAVDGITFTVHKGETIGIVGESGCGKTTTGRLLLRLIEATAGKVVFDGEDLFSLDHARVRQLRKRMQIVFQDPYASLNPRMTTGDIVAENLRIHNIGTKAEQQDRVARLLEKVGLRAADMKRYPHEFSGGQRQRIGIARALTLNPDLIVGDEPVSALDVSIQAQIINLLEDFQAEFALTYVIIAHNLSLIEHISDRVVVMYLGKIVEISPAEELYRAPLHPYTEALLSAVPMASASPKRKDRIILQGDVPSPINPPAGCRFHPRCPYKRPLCAEAEPPLTHAAAGRTVACHFPLGAR